MAEPFTPDAEELPPITDLEELSQVTEDDIEAAAQKWRDNPPSEEYTNILDAEEVEDG